MNTNLTKRNGSACSDRFGSSFFLDEWPFDQFLKHVEPRSRAAVVGRKLQADIIDYGDRYSIEIDVPSLKREDIELSVHENDITVKVKRKESSLEEGAKYLHRSRWVGESSQTFRLHDDVDSSRDVEASLVDGVLRVTIHKKAETQPRKIDIKTH